MRTTFPAFLLQVALLCSIIQVVICPSAHAIPADGSLEGNTSPEEASPAWTGPGKDRPSLLGWMEVRDGSLVQKKGVSEWASMQLVPVPFIGLSYTVECRFRITRCNLKSRYSNPLVIDIRTKGLCSIQVNIGQHGQRGSIQMVAAGKKALLVDDGLIQGQWWTLRLVVEGGVNSVRTKIFINGEKRQDASNGNVQDLEWFYIRSDADADAWEIDYVRWKNSALDIDVPLARPATLQEQLVELLQMSKLEPRDG